MGKRKKSSRTPQGPKKKQPLTTQFACLFCNHEESVSIKLDRKAGVGHLSCKVCGQTYQSNIHFLSEGVDVYSSWIDACDAVADDPVDARKSQSRGPRRNDTQASKEGGNPIDAQDEYEDDFVVNDEGDMEGNYTGAAGVDDDED